MEKKKVLLTGSKEHSQNYVSALKRQSLTAIFNSEEDADALLLTGGKDVCPCLYGKPILKTDELELERDCIELCLIKKFLSLNKPIFGICRGMQILNVYFGGTLLQNAKNLEIHSRMQSKTDKIHLNRTVNGTFCHKIFGTAFTANSAHHQAVDKLGTGLKPSAYAIDGTLEALYGKNVYAVQFHPERMTDEYVNGGDKLFSFFSQIIRLNSKF